MIATVKYQIATYSGKIIVIVDDENCDSEVIIAMAKKQLERWVGTLPFGYESWEIIDVR